MTSLKDKIFKINSLYTVQKYVIYETLNKDHLSDDNKSTHQNSIYQNLINNRFYKLTLSKLADKICDEFGERLFTLKVTQNTMIFLNFEDGEYFPTIKDKELNLLFLKSDNGFCCSLRSASELVNKDLTMHQRVELNQAISQYTDHNIHHLDRLQISDIDLKNPETFFKAITTFEPDIGNMNDKIHIETPVLPRSIGMKIGELIKDFCKKKELDEKADFYLLNPKNNTEYVKYAISRKRVENILNELASKPESTYVCTHEKYESVVIHHQKVEEDKLEIRHYGRVAYFSLGPLWDIKDILKDHTGRKFKKDGITYISRASSQEVHEQKRV